MREIYDPRTGDIDEQRVVVFCETIMRNTSAGDDDEFWGSGEKNLFKVAVLYTAFMREQSCSGCMSATQKNCWESCPMWRTKTGGASVL